MRSKTLWEAGVAHIPFELTLELQKLAERWAVLKTLNRLSEVFDLEEKIKTILGKEYSIKFEEDHFTISNKRYIPVKFYGEI